MTHRITTQKKLRAEFFATYPESNRKRIVDYRGDGLMYCADTRCAWVDFVDMLQRDGTISNDLADRATLDDES